MGPNDTLGITYEDAAGFRHELDTIRAGRYMLVDKVSFFDVKDEFGFKDGIVAIVGESEEEK